MTEILQLRSPADIRGVVVTTVLANASFSVTDVKDLEMGLKLLRSRHREGIPFAGLVVVGTLIFSDCNDENLLSDVMQMVNVAEDNGVVGVAFVSQILHGLGVDGLGDNPRVFEDRNGMADVVRYFQALYERINSDYG